jgi:TetR/AcrR family tetracycline transcriptional repressor
MALTTDDIVEVALDLLERDGLDGVSFRKIASELDVSAPTLLWHVDNKRRLLDLMAESLMERAYADGPGTPLPDEPWDAWLERHVRSMYTTLISHRDAPLVAAGNRPTPASLPGIEAALRTLILAGFEPGEAFETILAMGSYTIGCAVEWQAEARRASADEASPPDGELAEAVRSGNYPYLVAAFTQHVERRRHHPGRHSPHDGMFEHGLALILAGLRARLESRGEARPAGAAELVETAES